MEVCNERDLKQALICCRLNQEAQASNKGLRHRLLAQQRPRGSQCIHPQRGPRIWARLSQQTQTLLKYGSPTAEVMPGHGPPDGMTLLEFFSSQNLKGQRQLSLMGHRLSD